MDSEDTSQIGNSFLDKDLEAALDSFDNLFCRRCLVSILFVFCSIIWVYLSTHILFPFGRFLIADYMDVRKILSFL